MKSENSTAQIKCTSASAIHFYQSQSIHITNLEFIGCGGNQVRHVEELVVKDTKFKGQENSGTALELIETTAQIVNSTFLSNRKGLYKECAVSGYADCMNVFVGGAIIATNSTVDISRSRFEDNTADAGGAIFAEQGSIINISGNISVNNNADMGGGVLASDSSTITIEASEFHDNNAWRGGALYSRSSTITIEASEFRDNNAWSGGALYSRSSTITIEASEFRDNYAIYAGGVLDSDSSTITIEVSKFHDNNASHGGVLASDSSTITIEASKFCDNNASHGGVLDSYSSTIIIEASEFHDNNATRRGGALHSSSSTVTMEASEFHDNSASYYGGVLYSYSSTITIEANEFHDNNATRRGGVLYSYSSIVTIEASEFHNNSGSSGGVLYSYSGTVTIEASEFHDNSASYDGGVLDSSRSTITIEASEFHDNSANYDGGVLDSSRSTITIEGSEFHDNSASYDGGVLDSSHSTITIEESEFHDNSASYDGGVLESSRSTITIEESEFHDNSASYDGGVLDSSRSTITIEASEFHNNIASYGGVLYSSSSTITIKASEFHDNNAIWSGGVLDSDASNITITGSNFTNNVSPIGAIIDATSRSTIQHNSFLLIDSNKAHRYALIYISDSEFIGNDSGNATFSSNLGSLMAFNSNITFTGYVTFVNNTPSQTVSGDTQEGGAITLLQSNIFFSGKCNLKHNHAENGGAIHSTESKIYMNGDVTIAHNTATGNGGGVYLSTSELNCQQKTTFELGNNTASHKGGGLHAISSSIRAASSSSGFPQNVYTGARISITGNAAERGGGLSLEANAKLYILKYDYYLYYYDDNFNTTTFTANSADYGGAIYVDDDTNSGTCARNTETECFFQVLALHSFESSDLETQSMHFTQNHASISGSTLYGGLLDRCAVNSSAEVHNKYPRDFKDRDDGIAYFKNVSTPTYFIHDIFGNSEEIVIVANISVSSDPVRVCICFNSDQKNDCTHQYYTEIKKGRIVAVDQIGQPVSATIQTSLHFTESGLAKGQLAREIPAECTNLIFNVVSSHKSESLSLYASDGPCKDAEFSSATVKIHFLPCSSCLIGLQVKATSCTCDCHSDISQYMDHCDSHTGLLTKQPQTRAWISYINDTDLTGYLVYPNCPFDYCL